MLIELSRSFLCANDHITASAVQCDCGSRALVSLAGILNRVEKNLDIAISECNLVLGIYALPTMREYFGDN